VGGDAEDSSVEQLFDERGLMFVVLKVSCLGFVEGFVLLFDGPQRDAQRAVEACDRTSDHHRLF